MSNKKVPVSELKILRKEAVEAIVIHGMSKKQASITFSFSRTSIWKYLKEYKVYKEQSFQYTKRGVKAGTGSKMSKDQIQELKSNILSHTPDALGMNYTLWNSKVIQEYIELTYFCQYNRPSIRKIMSRLSFTSQNQSSCPIRVTQRK